MADLDGIAVSLDDVTVAVVDGVSAWRVIMMRPCARNDYRGIAIPSKNGLAEASQDVDIADTLSLIEFDLVSPCDCLSGREVDLD